MRHTGRASAKLHPASLPGGPLDPQPLRVAKIPVSSRLFTIAIRSAARTWPSHHHAAPSRNGTPSSEGMGFLVHSGRTTKPPAAPDDRSPLRPHRRRSIRRHQRPATVRAERRADEPILRTEPDGDQQVSDDKWLHASWPEARACYSPTRALRLRDLYVYLRLHRLQPITKLQLLPAA